MLYLGNRSSYKAVKCSLLEADILILLLLSYRWIVHMSRCLIPNLSAKSSVLIFTDESKVYWSQNKCKSPKYHLVYMTYLKHKRRQTHICKLSSSCNLIYIWWCIHSVEKLINPVTFNSWGLSFWYRCCDHTVESFAQIVVYPKTWLLTIIIFISMKVLFIQVWRNLNL